MSTSIVLAHPTDVPDVMHDDSAFARIEKLSALLARSQLLPAAFRGRPEDVFFAFLIAQRMGVDVFTVLQSIHFVNGKPGWSAPFLISRANASGVFEGVITFATTGEGPTLAVTASATLKRTGERVSRTVSHEMARKDGWTKNAKYSSIPEQMLSYRAATFLIRLYCPGILYGLHTSDEVEDVEAARGRTVEPVRVAEALDTTPKPRKRKAIDATPTEEHVVLVGEVAAARGAVLLEEHEPLPETKDPPRDGDRVEVDEAGNDVFVPAEVPASTPTGAPPREVTGPSREWTQAEAIHWSRECQARNVDHDVVSDLCETATPPRPRPRVLTADQRDALLQWVTTSVKGRERYAETAAQRTEALTDARRLSRHDRKAAAERAGTDTEPGKLSLLELRKLLGAMDEIEAERDAAARAEDSGGDDYQPDDEIEVDDGTEVNP